MNKKTIDDLDLNGKKTLVRVDFNVPIQNGIITSDKRISATIPTIKKIIHEGGKIILFSHLGRISSKKDQKKTTLAPIAKNLANKLQKNVKFISKTKGKKLEVAINKMKNGEIIMLQNTRYEDLDGKKESQNNLELGKYWASLGEVFINDAFGTAHRSHASNVGIASNIAESAIGYLIQKELKMLDKGLKNPSHPFVVILGGAKVSDKIAIIKNLIYKADKILIGGGMSYTFEAAKGSKIGNSLLEPDYINMAKKFIKQGGNKIILPLDHAISKNYADNPRKETKSKNIPNGFMGLDIGQKTIKKFQKELKGAKTILWNGPMGVSEFENFKQGTESIAYAITNQKNVFSIIGGGDSAATAIKLGFEKKFTHISTGGGASLQYMEGKSLPGIEAIQDKKDLKKKDTNA